MVLLQQSGSSRIAYDSWGKLTGVTRGEKKATFQYDYFGRMVEKRDGEIVTTYAYNPWGQRTSRVTKNGALTLEETRSYDKFGRLVEIASEGKSVKYSYDAKNRLAMQMADNMPIEFDYTKYGQLENKTLGGKLKPVSSLTYLYTKSGQIAGRVVDGKHQMYGYDKKGQLLSVADMHGNIAESYTYDPAGNILSKTVDGKTTTCTYDKANQLVTSTTGGVTTNYKYDAAGRLVKEGDKTYTYGWLDKILSVKENGEQTASFDYHIDGQVASAMHGDKTENFLWDGLALIHRGETGYINEPYATGGNPLLSSKGEVMFNDMLGSTLGVNGETGFNPVKMTAFGETEDKEAFFTGKPAVGELGYAFLMRNYRADQGKWQTTDPLGYPDGWNNLAYCNNRVATCIDWLGAWTLISDSGMPPTPASVTSTTSWVNGENYSSYGVYSVTTYNWVQIATNGGTNGTVSIETGNAYTTSSSSVLQFGASLGGSITTSASAKGSFPGIAEFGAEVSATVSGTVSGSYSLQEGSSSTVTITLSYSGTAAKNEYLEIIAYQLQATTTYYAKYIPESTIPGLIMPIQNLGSIGGFTANLSHFGSRQKRYE